MYKYRIATNFYNQFIRLTDAKKEEFSRLTNKLLSVNYLCASRPRNREDYYKIVADLDVYINYFLLMDYVLEHHSVDKVINLYNNQNYNRYMFKKNESLVILLLRRFYYQKMQEISLLDDITITLEELHDAISETGIVEKRLNKGEIKEIRHAGMYAGMTYHFACGIHKIRISQLINFLMKITENFRSCQEGVFPFRHGEGSRM